MIKEYGMAGFISISPKEPKDMIEKLGWVKYQTQNADGTESSGYVKDEVTNKINEIIQAVNRLEEWAKKQERDEGKLMAKD
jgi:hypothetical protein